MGGRYGAWEAGEWTPEAALALTKPTDDFLCPLSANTYGLDFKEFEIKDYDRGISLFHVARPADAPAVEASSVPNGVTLLSAPVKKIDSGSSSRRFASSDAPSAPCCARSAARCPEATSTAKLEAGMGCAAPSGSHALLPGSAAQPAAPAPLARWAAGQASHSLAPSVRSE